MLMMNFTQVEMEVKVRSTSEYVLAALVNAL